MHASSDLRESFEEWAEGGRLSPTVEAKRLTGQLWNCTDIMPGGLCDDLDIARGSTYAQGVRSIRAIILTSA